VSIDRPAFPSYECPIHPLPLVAPCEPFFPLAADPKDEPEGLRTMVALFLREAVSPFCAFLEGV
jgi:hypothetical protein